MIAPGQPQQQAAPQGIPPQVMQLAQAISQLRQQIAAVEAHKCPPLHDVVFKRTKKRPQVRIENVPPEEFLISRRAKTIADAPFIAHRVQRTLSELRALGYKNVEKITSDDRMASLSPERIERASWDDDWANLPGQQENSLDQSARVVWLTECYMKVDFDNDGITEWRKITRAGNQLLDNEECDGPPFVSITPIPLPHRFHGLSIADLAIPVQKQKTAVLRAALDNLYLQVNGRYFAVDGQVNLDDLLTSRPGGVVRVKQPGMAGRLDQGAGDVGNAFQMLEYLETQKENRTGWSRTSQGANVDSLNDTATGVNVTTNRADSRVELIARVFSETGVRDLFRMILKLVSQHQDRQAQMQVSGEWVSFDPRGWRNQFDVRINVGLGTGNKDQVVQHLMALMQVQREALAIGVTTPQNIYRAAMKLAENLSLPQPEQFFTDPQQNPQPPHPDPAAAQAQAQVQIAQANGQVTMQVEQAKLQAQMQMEQARGQAEIQMDAAKRQHEQQVEAARMQMQAQVDTHRQQVEAQQKSQEIAQQRELDQFRAQLSAQGEAQKMELERWKAQLASDTEIYIARLKIGAEQDASLLQDRMMAAEEDAEAEAIEPGGAPL